MVGMFGTSSVSLQRKLIKRNKLVVGGNYLYLFAFNQYFAKAYVSGDGCFLYRKLYQVSVNAKVRAVRSVSKTVLLDTHGCKGKKSALW